MSTRMCIVGTVATVPYFSKSGDRVAFCSFRVASNDRVFDQERQQWVDTATNWFTVNAFRSLAEHARKSLSVGDRIVAYGRVRVNNWESKGKVGTSTELEVEALGPDLRWGVTTFTKLVEARPASESGASSPPAPTHGSEASEEYSNAPEIGSGWAAADSADSSDAGEFGRAAA